ncbi:flagellar basal body L-ring protein FlgH [Verrucomicrobium sp. GAS474]|uniref:flagellar basal body L-ring protein FlgH n=1 Tax=Verrucomicrobium sp. GAS474 TaxID=1882831 RepID=UPI0012FFBA42|nr:flagellar basal body L-ring protein FlgH [Verrucomicrobium sp. GAS474]
MSALLFAAVLLFVDRGFAEVLGPGRISPYSAPGSIFPADPNSVGGRSKSLYSDPSACSIGDTVTIVVNLSQVSTRAKTLATGKTASVNDSVTSFLIPNNVAGNYGNQWAGAQTFAGSGSQTSNEVMTTTVQARITEVYPNGTFRVEALRVQQNDKERTTLTLSGIVRQQDLDATNAVSSTQVADLQIKSDGVGDVTRATRKGWITTIYEFINPF